MKTILIPTDFSKNALHALQYAQELFKCDRAEFYLMHAFADEVYGGFLNKPVEERERTEKQIRKEVTQKLEDLLESVIGVPPNPMHKWHTVAAFDSLVDGVNDFVNQKNIDLVVMGTKGETSDHKTTFGSYTVQLFKYVSCPVLAIPADCVYQQPKVILFPTDYMLPYKRRELKLLGDLAGHFKSQVHCLYISDFDVMSHRQEDNRLFIKETLSKAYLSFKRTSVKNKGEAIMEYIKANKVGMLTMVNSRHSFFEDMLYRSTIDELGLKVKIPFLVMQNLYR
ncbi:MAG: universal stress protein [Croceitalea sp.]|nr:universal stress protein [Croceitalea sp.]